MSQFLVQSTVCRSFLGTATTNYTVTDEADFGFALQDTVPTMSEFTAVLNCRKVLFLDFGIENAKGLWDRMVRPNLDEFRRDPTPKSAHNLATSLWPVVNWIFYDRHPNEDDRSHIYTQFCSDQISRCNHVGSVREIANAWKHRGLSRGKIKTARTNAPTLEVIFDDGTAIPMGEMFEDVVAHVENELCQDM